MAADHDFSTWPRRSEAAKRLGISVATLRRYEGNLITPIKDKNGENRFDPQELAVLAETLRKRSQRKAKRASHAVGALQSRRSLKRGEVATARVSGAVTRRAFGMFEEGKSRARVAIELEESVENVNWLYENWIAMSGREAPRSMLPANGGAVLRSDAAVERLLPMRWTSPEMVRQRPPDTWTESDRELLRYEAEIDARKRRDEEERGAQLRGDVELTAKRGSAQ